MQPSLPARRLSAHIFTIHQCLWILMLLTISILWADSLSHAKPAQDHERTTLNDITQGTLLIRSSTEESVFPAPTLHTDVQISVTGLIARATVRQEFQNPGSEWTEGIYVFPLPETAAVDHLRMYMGARVIEGVIQERTEAKKTYTTAKQQGKKASLVEQERSNVFTTSVANIGPNERVTIEIEYQETVRYDSNLFSLRFPMVVGPRYIPGLNVPIHEHLSEPDGHGWAQNTQQVPDASRITPPVQHPKDGPLNPISLTINLAPGFPLADITSRYHPIQNTKDQEGHHLIQLKDGKVPADRDFELTWSSAQEHAPKAAIFSENYNDQSYMLLMVMPPSGNVSGLVPLSRDVTFVIDTSGSMHGASIEQAKLALQLALTRLQAQDRFNVIQFNDKTHSLFPSAQPATARTLRLAAQYVQGLEAEGGTEMLPALQIALQHHDTQADVRQVIFITDGQIGNETQLFRAITKDLGDTRLFTVGIGSAPNSHFMRRAAKFGRGTFTYIGLTTEVQDQMGRLFQKLEHPVITNIELELPHDSSLELVPERIPDLYLGEPLLVSLRSHLFPNAIRIKGDIGTRAWSTTLSLEHVPQRKGISTYWARQTITDLMDRNVERREEDSLRQSVTDIALEHHLVSRYTSLVAVDVTPSRSKNQPLSTHAMKTNLPHGQDYTAIFGLAAGATDGPWHVTVGLILLLMAFASYRLAKASS